MDHQNIEEQVYVFIRTYIRQHRHPPTVREIGSACHMSHSGVIRYLDRLEARGRISRKPGKSRGITLLDDESDS
jgi:repressor LexA